MADFPIRGVVTLTFFKDTLESVFASESVEFVKSWLELGDKALALNPLVIRREGHHRAGRSTSGSGHLHHTRQGYERRASCREIHKFSIVALSSVHPKKRRNTT